MATMTRDELAATLSTLSAGGDMSPVLEALDAEIETMDLDPACLEDDDQWDLLRALHMGLTGLFDVVAADGGEPLSTFLMWTLSPGWEESHFETPEHLIERAEAGGYPEGATEILETGTLLDVVGDDEDMLIVGIYDGYALIGPGAVVQLDTVSDLVNHLAGIARSG